MQETTTRVQADKANNTRARVFRQLTLAQITLIFALIPYGRTVERSLRSATSLLPGTETMQLLVGVGIIAWLILQIVRAILSQGVSSSSISGIVALMLLLALSAYLPGSPAEFTHLPLYGGLSLFLCGYFLARGKSPYSAVGMAIFLATGVGLLDECFQGLLPERVFDPRDLLLNLLGACWGAPLLYIFCRNSLPQSTASENPSDFLKQQPKTVEISN